MVAVPFVLIVLGYDKQILPLERRDDLGAVALSGYRIAQRRRKGVEEGGLDQESFHIR